MRRIWNWDFEDERGRRRSPARKAPRPLAAPSLPRSPLQRVSRARLVQVRRRRGGAVLVALLGLVLIGVLLSSSGGRQHASAATGASTLGGRAHAPLPTDPEKDQLGAVASTLAFTPFVRAGGGNAREIALTFDDGPGPYTPQILSVLEHYHVKATFFVIGRMLRYFGATTARAIEDGDVIGDHTETHPMLAQLSAHEQKEELFEQILRVEVLGGKRPTLFRPPYGSFNATTLRQLKALHLLMVLWSADTGDYQQPGVPVIVERALAGAKPGAIILMHDGGGTRTQTIEALPLIIKGLRSRGYKLVSVPQLLLDDPPPAGQPLPTSLAGD
jgi:peptidoglycan/xylan/chitin deacetylase (PgdA/CDA1 family)